MNEFCGSALLTFVITMSAARWPTLGSIMYGLAVYWCLQMHPYRLFNPALNLFFRPLFFNAVEDEDEDRRLQKAKHFGMALTEAACDLAGAFATVWLIRGLTDGALPSDPYVLAETPKVATNSSALYSLKDTRMQHYHHDVGDVDVPIFASVAEFIGLLMLWTAAYDNAPGQKRAVTLGIATTIASFSLAQFSGGIFNIAIQGSMALVVGGWNTQDQSTKDVFQISGYSMLFLLFFMWLIYSLQVWSDGTMDFRPAWLRLNVTIEDLKAYKGSFYETESLTFKKEAGVDLAGSNAAKNGSSWSL